MSAAVRTPTVGTVSDDVGTRIQARRTRIGIGKSALAKRAGLNRSTLAAIENGEVSPRDTTVSMIERALDDLEHEMGWDGPDAVMSTEAGLMEFGVNVDAIGVHVVVKGPIANAAELEASVARLIRDIRQGTEDRPDLSDS